MHYPKLTFIHGLLQNYIKIRLKEAETMSNAASQIFSSLIGTTQSTNTLSQVLLISFHIQEKCAEAFHAETDTEKGKAFNDLLITLGEQAYLAQKNSTKQSRFGEVIHAVRTYILSFAIHFPEFKSQIENSINELKTKLGKIIENEARDQIIRQMVYLGDIESLKGLGEKQLNTLFPTLIYPAENNSIFISNNFSVELPFLIQKNYYHKYVADHFGENISVKTLEHQLEDKYLKMGGFKSTQLLQSQTNNSVNTSVNLQTTTINKTTANNIVIAAENQNIPEEMDEKELQTESQHESTNKQDAYPTQMLFKNATKTGSNLQRNNNTNGKPNKKLG
jgi:hypothetical protein